MYIATEIDNNIVQIMDEIKKNTGTPRTWLINMALKEKYGTVENKK